MSVYRGLLRARVCARGGGGSRYSISASAPEYARCECTDILPLRVLVFSAVIVKAIPDPFQNQQSVTWRLYCNLWWIGDLFFVSKMMMMVLVKMILLTWLSMHQQILLTVVRIHWESEHFSGHLLHCWNATGVVLLSAKLALPHLMAENQIEQEEIVEARSWRSKCPQNWFHSEVSPWLVDGCLLLVSSHGLSSVRVCFLLFSSSPVRFL